MWLGQTSNQVWPAWTEVTRIGTTLRVRCLPCDFVEPRRIQRFHVLVQQELSRGTSRIELDLTQSDVADTKLVALLILAYRKAHREGVDLHVSVSDRIQSLLDICRCGELAG
ncbi:MAG: hypothetical protein QGG74_06470 [Phycisphaerales bacterium]|jgi:hypothetical protein|nr:hypothetical protein [Phycisphaerales bacterium]